MLNKFDNIINYKKINELGLQKECFYAFNGINKLFDMNIPLDKIDIENLNFLNTITDVINKKVYKYEMDFIDWIFCAKRKDFLHEIKI